MKEILLLYRFNYIFVIQFNMYTSAPSYLWPQRLSVNTTKNLDHWREGEREVH